MEIFSPLINSANIAERNVQSVLFGHRRKLGGLRRGTSMQEYSGLSGAAGTMRMGAWGCANEGAG